MVGSNYLNVFIYIYIYICIKSLYTYWPFEDLVIYFVVAFGDTLVCHALI